MAPSKRKEMTKSGLKAMMLLGHFIVLHIRAHAEPKKPGLYQHY